MPNRDLVTLDDSGSVHAIGVVASKRMRDRVGDFRMLPAPSEVILMRAVQVLNGSVHESESRVRLIGEISNRGDICDIFGFLGQTGWRGRLLISDNEFVRVVVVENGSVIGVQTNNPMERLGQVMFRFGILTQPELQRVLAAAKKGVRFGEAATRVGGLEDGTVYEYIGHQIREVVCATFAIKDGGYCFLDDFEDASLASGHAIPVNALLTEGVTRMDEIEYFRKRIPSDQHSVVRLKETPPEGDQAIQIFKRVNAQRSVEELGRLTGLGEFETTKALYSLVRSGHVAIRPPRLHGGEGAIIEQASDALREVFRVAIAAGKDRELRNNLESFMQGMGLYPVLLQDAGPGSDGSLNSSQVVKNLGRVASKADRERVLKDLLGQLVSFALFTTGASVGAKREGPMKKSISGTMRALRPEGD